MLYINKYLVIFTMSIFQQQSLITDESITLKTDSVLNKENIEIERERETIRFI